MSLNTNAYIGKYFSIENDIKKTILNNFSNEKKYFDIDYFYSFLKEQDEFSDVEYLEQLTKNVLSKMSKDNEIIRIKRGLYTFSTELFEMRDLVDQEEFKDKLVIYDILYDFLTEKTQAIPSMYNVYIDESLFGNFSVNSLSLFFNHYSNFKKINNVSKLNEKDLLLFKIFIYFLDSKSLYSNELELYIFKKMNELNITRQDLNFTNLNNILKNVRMFVNKNTIKVFSKHMIKIFSD